MAYVSLLNIVCVIIHTIDKASVTFYDYLCSKDEEMRKIYVDDYIINFTQHIDCFNNTCDIVDYYDYECSKLLYVAFDECNKNYAYSEDFLCSLLSMYNIKSENYKDDNWRDEYTHCIDIES